MLRHRCPEGVRISSLKKPSEAIRRVAESATQHLLPRKRLREAICVFSVNRVKSEWNGVERSGGRGTKPGRR